MLVTLENMKLALYEARSLPERAKNPETGKWEPTGGKSEMSLYTFRDEFGEVLKFLGKNDYRVHEGKNVVLSLDVSFNDYENKNKVTLKDVNLQPKG